MSTNPSSTAGLRAIADQADESTMPDHSALTQHLAEKAFQMIDRTEFHVSAVLSLDRPETLKNFGTLESILLMAYNAGRASAGAHDTTSAYDALG